MDEVVDILVTTYNTNEKYLKKQIESILRQTYKNIKIYISDDNSNKNEIKELLEEYEKNDNRIRLFLQPQNLGYNKNFEFLLQQSTANYIMFSDHDDVWHKDKVEKSLKLLKDKDVDIKDDPEAVVLTVVAVHNGAVPETVTPEEAETEETK